MIDFNYSNEYILKTYRIKREHLEIKFCMMQITLISICTWIYLNLIQ